MSLSLAAGDLDRRIVLQRAARTPNAFNEPEEDWTVLATVWASKTDVSDGERARAAETEATITTRFRIRWSSRVADLSPKDRLQYAGLTYGIIIVKELGRRVGLEISATARTDQG